MGHGRLSRRGCGRRGGLRLWTYLQDPVRNDIAGHVGIEALLARSDVTPVVVYSGLNNLLDYTRYARIGAVVGRVGQSPGVAYRDVKGLSAAQVQRRGQPDSAIVGNRITGGTFFLVPGE